MDLLPLPLPFYDSQPVLILHEQARSFSAVPAGSSQMGLKLFPHFFRCPQSQHEHPQQYLTVPAGLLCFDSLLREKFFLYFCSVHGLARHHPKDLVGSFHFETERSQQVSPTLEKGLEQVQRASAIPVESFHFEAEQPQPVFPSHEKKPEQVLQPSVIPVESFHPETEQPQPVFPSHEQKPEQVQRI